MDIFVWVFFIFEAILGFASSIGIIVILIATIFSKIMGKVRYGKSLYD